MAQSPIVRQIIEGARARGIDPQAALAVARVEGLGGGVGDGGHAFGPFQLNDAGGVLTNRPGNHRQFAESPAGINWALDQIAGVARGLHGRGAVNAIVRRFERPANPDAEVQKALGLYGGGGGATTPGIAGSITGGIPAPSPPQQGGLPPIVASLFAQNQQALGAPTPPALLAGLLSSPGASTAPRTSRLKVQVQGKPDSRAKGAVALAHEYLGTPYVWGGEKPGGFDCSGLVQYVMAQQGVNVPRTTYEQFKHGQPIGKAQLQAGDAVFFHPTKGGPAHEGLYIGGGRFIEAPHTGATVRVSKLAGRSDFIGGRRFA